MVFHEVYGEVSKRTLSLIKKNNVTPAEWYMIEFEFATDKERADHIVSHSMNGVYHVPLGYFKA